MLTHHELLTTTATFADAVAALRQASIALGHPEWETIVVEEAQRPASTSPDPRRPGSVALTVCPGIPG